MNGVGIPGESGGGAFAANSGSRLAESELTRGSCCSAYTSRKVLTTNVPSASCRTGWERSFSYRGHGFARLEKSLEKLVKAAK